MNSYDLHNKSILIVSFVFPPFPGIGGRRWTKFSKELAKRGFQVFVVAAKNPFREISPWQKDIRHPNIIIKYLPLKFPNIIISIPKNIFEKILYRMSLLFLKLTVKANYYDRSVNWKTQVQWEAEKIIQKNNIQNIIVSGAPFHLINHIVKLKKKYPDKNFIADFRDPWTNNPNFFGFSSLSERRQKIEKQMEKEVIETADVVISVAEEMNEHFRNLTLKKTKFITIGNGFDPEEFNYLTIKEKKGEKKGAKLKFIFTGTLYNDMNDLFSSFIQVLILLKKNYHEMYGLLQFDFYGEFPDEYGKIVFRNNLECIKRYNYIGLEEVHQKIAEADICMLFLQNNLNFSFSTKFCEYIAHKRKILVFSNYGRTADFIVKNNLGYAASRDDMLKVLLKIIYDYRNDNLKFNNEFDITRYSLHDLTDKLVTCLK